MISLSWFLLQANGAMQAAAGAAQATDGGQSEGAGTPELPNVVSIASKAFHQPWLEDWIDIIFSFAIMLIIFIVFASAAKKMKKLPDRKQGLVEIIVTGLDRFVVDILGKQGHFYTPMIGTLFIYVLVMNLWGIVPILGHSPTSSLNITLSLALFVFITVQAHGIKQLGLLGYIKHFADLPEHPSGLQWAMVPLMFPLHIVGELAKPLSLSLRLFGNITGEDALIAAFAMLVAYVPLQVTMYPIVLIGSTIQALVFASLSTVYILMMSPHEEEH
jgi:F-type H+-transporting ATPase subunit a